MSLTTRPPFRTSKTISFLKRQLGSNYNMDIKPTAIKLTRTIQVGTTVTRRSEVLAADKLALTDRQPDRLSFTIELLTLRVAFRAVKTLITTVVTDHSRTSIRTTRSELVMEFRTSSRTRTKATDKEIRMLERYQLRTPNFKSRQTTHQPVSTGGTFAIEAGSETRPIANSKQRTTFTGQTISKLIVMGTTTMLMERTGPPWDP